MQIDSHTLQFTLTVKEVDIWLTALRIAALKAGPSFGYKDAGKDGGNAFTEQHAELVRLTGYSAGDHKSMMEELRQTPIVGFPPASEVRA